MGGTNLKNLSAVILLCNAAWMTIYLYGEYAISSAKYHSSLIIFPITLFTLALILFYFSTLRIDLKNTFENNEEN